MDLARLHPVSLFAVWITVVTALVEPPGNVTLHCHNLTNILKWDYNQLTPGVKFRVDIQPYKGAAENFLVEPSDLQAELPPLIDPREEFYVTVTAVMGEEESEPSPSDGLIFTYSQESLVEKKCVVDLPSVNVTIQPHDQIEFRFEHPWLLYKKKLRGGGESKSKQRRSHDALRSERLPLFTYKVMVVNQGKQPHSDYCEERVCTNTLPVDAAKKEHCLTINGEMNLISVKSNQEFCAQPGEAPSYDYIYVIVSVLVLIPVAAIGFMVYHKRTRPLSSTPAPLFPGSFLKQPVRPLPVLTDNVQEVQVASPTPLLTSTDEEDGREFTTVPDYDMRFPIGVTEEDEGVSDVTEREEPNVEGSDYMGGRHLEGEEPDEGRSAYESRIPVTVELAPDETAEGYRA
ncbi:interferon gamma receptor 1-like isoform X2 [Acanthochromis polyacanthus]|uniref:interferon gamma receptor 1-like isoform X2 n=1 Tax=Acanthochromis polyacanthus TaxID=80966 RepID=UPI00223423D3|nr:interferon gamma receptor 1-like isoform X2 [Acanthochromis polyacanthus]